MANAPKYYNGQHTCAQIDAAIEQAAQVPEIASAVAAKQAELTETQLAAVDSGIDSAKVAKIDTTADAATKLLNGGSKNLVRITQFKQTETLKGITATYDPITGIVELNGAHDGSSGGAIFELYTGAAADQEKIPAGTYHLSGCPSGGSTSTYRVSLNGTSVVDTGNGADFTLSSATALAPRILISKPSGQEVSFDHVQVKIMVCAKSDYDASHEFAPYCPSVHEMYAASKQPLAGKKVSFYGDSITTFVGWVPSGNKPFYTGSNCGVNSVYRTWWMKTLLGTGAELCVDQAWSGRCVSNIRDAETDLVGSGAWRQSEVDKIGTSGSTPDIIIIKLGINDFNNVSCQIGEYDGTEALPTVPDNGFSTFRESYATMLDRIMTTFPLARVYCCTLNQVERSGSVGFPEINGLGESLTEYNDAIKQLAQAFGATVIDHAACGMTYYNMSEYTGDWEPETGRGLHPNAAGMALIADKTVAALLCDYTG